MKSETPKNNFYKSPSFAALEAKIAQQLEAERKEMAVITSTWSPETREFFGLPKEPQALDKAA